MEKITRPTILMVTEAAFYPPYRGDSRRLFTLITNLRERGWRVFLVHLHDRAQPDVDYEAMAGLCEDLFIYYPTNKDLKQRNWGDMDSYCPVGLIQLVATTVRRVRPHVLLTQFVLLSRCLEIATECRPVKVIDADNKFSGRAELYREKGIPYDWFSTDEAQERRGLLRADLILAIQEREAEFFARLLPERPVLMLPHLEPIRSHPPVESQTLLFVGAANFENAAGITGFLKQALPAIKLRHPKALLKIAGRVCELIEGSWEQVEFMRLVDQLDPLYAEAAIVINPAPAGSGIKIKTVEALCQGKCLVTTSYGSQGLENYGHAYCLADTPQQFGTIVNSLLDEPGRIKDIGRCALEFAANYFDPGLILTRFEEAVFSQRRVLKMAP